MYLTQYYPIGQYTGSLPDMILQRIIVVNAESSREGPQCPVHTV